jgi:probable phosphomutase (TIGR03848 family)
MTTIILVRHGENEWVKEHKLAGWIAGVHLNEKGHEQAKNTAVRLSHLPIHAIYTSPVTRCVETANYIAQSHNLPLQELPEVGEVRYGDWEGQAIADLRRDPLWQVVQHTPSRMTFPNGESMRGVQSRGVNAIEALAAQYPTQIIVVCSHADVIKMVLAHYLGTHLDLFQRIQIAPGSISAIHLGENGSIQVSCVNDVGPLEPPQPPQPKDE